MKCRIPTLLTGLALLELSTLKPQLSAAPLGMAFTYQGRLASGGVAANGSYELAFSLHDALASGGQVGNALTNTAVGVTNGLFTVTLDFGSGFDGNARWLEISVRTNGAGTFATLSPRQPLTPSPYALYAPTAGTAATATTAVTATAVAPGSVGSAGLAAGAVDSTKIADGSIAASDLSPALASNTFWRLRGNAGTSASLDFLGTLDMQPLKLRVNNALGWRLEPTAEGYPNVIGGRQDNAVASFGAVVGGGAFNVIATNAWCSTIGGGYQNQAGSNSNTSTISGGYSNVVGFDARNSAIGGGSHNTILDGAYGSAIAGGQGNTIGGSDSTVPGGFGNAAMGDFSFAAGTLAKANHAGSFVWADAQLVDFASTANNQFLVRAAGGVGINNTNPATALDVNGTVTAGGLNLSGAGRLNDNDVYFRSGSDTFHGLGWYGNPKYFAGVNVNGPVLYGFGGGALGYTGNGTNLALVWNASGNVGIGKNDPATALDVNGTVTATGFSGTFAGSGAGLTNVWQLGGNTGTAAGTHFLGTTDYQPLELKVNNTRALRLEPTVDVQYFNRIVNVVGGSPLNYLAPGVYGSVIAGGGAGDYNSDHGHPNGISADMSFIGGGNQNFIKEIASFSVIVGGEENSNEYNANHSFIGGGSRNSIQPWATHSFLGCGNGNSIQVSASYSFLGGGYYSSIQTNASYSFLGGGFENSIQAEARYSFLGGGTYNTNGAPYSVVPGGDRNFAGGTNSFAAGHRAKANYAGDFVWADSQNADFNSTAGDQFLIRAGGGVGINKANPATALDVNGTITGAGFNSGGPLRLNDNDTYFRAGSDTHHGLGWYGDPKYFAGVNVNGPVLYGNGGGALGAISTTTNIALQWDGSSNVSVKGALDVKGALNVFSETRLNEKELYLRGNGGDRNHGLGWYGASKPFGGLSLDGPALYGYSGGVLGTMNTGFATNVVLYWTNSGNVGIGTTSPDAKLTVNGTADKPGGGSWSTFSDARLKDVGDKFTHGLKDLEALQPVHYHYRADNPLQLPTEPEYVGVVAQAVQQAVPEAVERNQDGYLTVNNDPIIWTMVNAIKELNRKVDDRNAENAELKQTVRELKNLVASLAQKRNGDGQ